MHGKNKHALWKRKAAIVCFQEAKIPATKMATMCEEFRQNGWTLECGPCDDSTKQPGAGVGIATKGEHVQMIQTTTHTDDFKEAYESGRITKHIVDLGWEEHIIIYCLYGVSGGTPEAKKITGHLVANARNEMQFDPLRPKLLVGDINAEPASIPAIR